MWGCEAAPDVGGGAGGDRATPPADRGSRGEGRRLGGAAATEFAELLATPVDRSADRRAAPRAAAVGSPARGAARTRGSGPSAGAGGPGRPRDPAAPDALPRMRRRGAGHRSSAPAPAGGRAAGRAPDAHRVPVAHPDVRALRGRDAGAP